MGYTQGLISRWDMSDVNPQDLGFRKLGNHGVSSGLVAATDIVEGIAGGKATEFNGTDEVVTILDSPSLDITAAITLALWVKLADGTGQEILFSKWAAAQQSWFIDLSIGVPRFFVSGDGTTATFFSSTDGALALGEWHHLICVYDGTTLRVYRNGKAVSGTITGAVPGSLFSGTSIIQLATHRAASFYEGVIDEVMIFENPFTNIQARDLWNRTRRGTI